MNRPVQEAAARELDRAISADEQANNHYHQILRRFISRNMSIPEAGLHQIDIVLDAGGLKEIDTAWLKHNNTEKKLRTAYMKLYSAYL